jgi:hypothetical protein
MLMMGEVHTGLLRNSAAVSPALAREILTFVVGERVQMFSRPIDRAISGEHLTGVDTFLPYSSGGTVRGVGTVISRSVLTGGRIVQGSAYTGIAAGSTDRRLPWSYYLARPGVVEAIGKVELSRIADGHLSFKPSDVPTLDLTAVGAGALDIVQDRPGLDRTVPFRSQRTRLVWAVEPAGTADAALTFRFDGDDGGERSLRLPATGADLPAYARLCEDVALHDWLLTTVLSMVSRARIGSGDRPAVIDAIRPVLDYLAHLWMPAVRIDPDLIGFWDALDDHGSMDKQWRNTVSRIRDQLGIALVATKLG